MKIASEQLSVKVLTPERAQYEGPAFAVSSFSSRGPFSILPLHTNFIAIIRTRLSIFRTRTDHIDIPVDVGVVVCRENRVEVYLGITTETLPPARSQSSTVAALT